MSVVSSHAAMQAVYRRLCSSGLGSVPARCSVPTSLAYWREPTTSCLRHFSSTSSVFDSATSPVNLYQYKICPFSNIAKVVLTYQQVPYHSIEVNPLTKAELKFSKEYRKVPIVQRDEQQWNGTEEILEHFASVASSGNDSKHDGDFANSASSRHWQDFARNKLAPLLYPNLCNTLANSFRAFDYVHEEPRFSAMQRYSIQYVGSLAMYFAASKIKKKYQLDDVRVALEEALLELEEGLNESLADTPNSDGAIFLNPSSNTEPHLGDLAVFGVLKGLEGLPILMDDILQDGRFPRIQNWFQAMNDQVESRKKQ